jgi:hypothetical protein
MRPDSAKQSASRHEGSFFLGGLEIVMPTQALQVLQTEYGDYGGRIYDLLRAHRSGLSA